MLKERSKGLPQTPSSIDQVGSNDNDTMVLERTIGRKAEKTKRKRTNGDKGFEDYLVKKLQNIQESHEQDKEALCVKADRVWVDVQRVDIEKERFCFGTIREEGRIITIDTSGMNEKEILYCNLIYVQVF